MGRAVVYTGSSRSVPGALALIHVQGEFTQGFLEEDSDPIVFERITSCHWTDGLSKTGMQEAVVLGRR